MQKHVMSVVIVGIVCAAIGWSAGRSESVAAAVHTQQAVTTEPQAAYFSHGDMENVWKELEAKKAISKRVVEGGNYSITIRSLRETDAPLVHDSSIDIWVMEEGSATAVTGGKLLNPVKKPKVDDVAGSAIEGGVEHAFLPGDILYVPAGVPHGFKNVKGFRAYLIRCDVN